MSKYYKPTTNEIKALRCQVNLSQTEMADLLKCNVSTIQKWEQGVNSMPSGMWWAAQIIVANEMGVL